MDFAPVSPVLSRALGVAGVQTTLATTGSLSGAAAKSANFTATRTEALNYEITATGKTVALLDADPVGTEYQFFNVGTGFEAAPTVIDPEGATLINGAATLNFDRSYGAQYVRKVAAGTWLAGQ